MYLLCISSHPGNILCFGYPDATQVIEANRLIAIILMSLGLFVIYQVCIYSFHHPINYLEISSTPEISQVRGLKQGSSPRPPPRPVHAFHFHRASSSALRLLIDFHRNVLLTQCPFHEKHIVCRFRQNKTHESETRTRALQPGLVQLSS